MTIKILKNDTCPSISGKSTLKYQIGADDDDTIFLRITGSSGGGFFSNEWIALQDIQKTIADGKKNPRTAPCAENLEKTANKLGETAMHLGATAMENRKTSQAVLRCAAA